MNENQNQVAPEAQQVQQTAPEAPRPRRLEVQLIIKKSLYERDVKSFWTRLKGRKSDLEKDGHFTFPDASEFSEKDGIVRVVQGGSVYFYNMADFYRVKVTPIY